MAFEDIDTKQLESIACSLEKIAHALEGDEAEKCTLIECIAHALESIARSMDPDFKSLPLIRFDMEVSMRKEYELDSVAKSFE